MAQRTKTRIDVGATLRSLEASKAERAADDRALLVGVCSGTREEGAEAIAEAAERCGIGGDALVALQSAFDRRPELDELEKAVDESIEAVTEGADRIRARREELQLEIAALDAEYRELEQRRDVASGRFNTAADSMAISPVLLRDHEANESDRTRAALLEAAVKATSRQQPRVDETRTR